MYNIAFISKKFNSIGGIEKITSMLSNEFAKENNVFLFTTENEEKPVYKLDEKVKIVKLGNPSKKIRFLFEIKKVLRKNKIDFLIIQDKELGFITYLKMNRLRRCKFVFCDHSSFNYYYTNNIINEVERRRKYTKHADAVVVLTSDNLDLYKKQFSYKDKKVFLIPNFVDFENKGNKYCESSKTITAVGRLHSQKRFDLLIESFTNVAKKHSDWKLEIYGDGNDKEQLENLIKENKMEKNIFLMGNYKSIDDAYLNKSFMCVTSEFEGFGIMILEALNYNLPVVSFNCLSGPSDMVIDGFNGYLVETLQMNEMTDKINDLVENLNKRISFSENAKTISKKFEKEVVVGKWYNLFKLKK